jgi:hypothetical protein
MTIKIVPNDKGNPPGKLADVELHFTSGPLEGLKLIGFSVWGTSNRQRPERHIPREAIQRERGAPEFCSLASRGGHRRAGPHS